MPPFKLVFSLPLLLFATSGIANSVIDHARQEQHRAMLEPIVVVITGQRWVGSPFSGLNIPMSGSFALPEVSDLSDGTPAISAPASANDSNKESEQGCKSTSNPVLIATGEKHKSEPDFQHQGLYGLSLTRTYRSRIAEGSLFGPHWLSSLDAPKLDYEACFVPGYGYHCVPRSITHTDEKGTKFVYHYVGHGPIEDVGGLSERGLDGKIMTPAQLAKAAQLAVALPKPPGPAGTDYPARRPSEYYYEAGKAAAVTGRLTYSPFRPVVVSRNGARYMFTWQKRIQRIIDKAGTVQRRYTWSEATETSWPRLEAITSLGGQSVQLTWGENGRVSQLQDPAGEVWHYEYDQHGMLSKVTSPGENPDVRQYHYEGGDKTLLTGITIGERRYSNYSYYTDRRVETSALAGDGHKDSFVYGDKSTTITNAQGQKTKYSHVLVNGELKISSIDREGTATCAAARARTVYDNNGFVNYTLDWKGNRTDYQHDPSGRLLSMTRAAGTADAVTEALSWSEDIITQRTYLDASGNPYLTIDYAYHQGGKEAGQLAEVRQTENKTGQQRITRYQYAYHPSGALAAQTVAGVLDGRELGLTSTYDTEGNLTSIRDPSGLATSYADYTGLGSARTVTNSSGVSTTYSYNPDGTIATVTEVGNRITRTRYNAARQPTFITNPDGSATRFVYNAAGKLEKIGNAQGQYVSSMYDLGTNSIRQSAPRQVPSMGPGGPTASAGGQFSATTLLDSLKRTYAKVGNNKREDIRYDSNGNVTEIAVDGKSTRYDYDANNRVTRVSTPDGGDIRTEYDHAGRVRAVTDPRGLTTTYTYNDFGDLTSIQSPDTGLTSFTQYDALGRLLSETRNDGKVFAYAWDDVSRLRSRRSGNAGEAYHYDEGTYGKGRLTSFTDATGRTSYTYDHAGQLVQQDNDIYGGKYTTRWSYDAAGRNVGMRYPTDLVLGFDYDAAGRLSKVRSNLANAWSTLADSFLYQPATNALFGWRFGNSLPRLVTLDHDGRIERLDSQGAHKLAFAYHPAGTIAKVTDNVVPNLTAEYGYDEASRVNSISRPGDWQVFTWDQATNRTEHRREHLGDFFYTLDNNSNRLAGWQGAGKTRTFGYDSVGNVVNDAHNDGNYTYSYDDFNRMNGVFINGTQVGDYRNNALNQRSYKIAGGVGVAAIYGPSGELLAEIGPTVTSYVWVGSELLGVARGGSFYASHNDQVGRPEVLTDERGGVACEPRMPLSTAG